MSQCLPLLLLQVAAVVATSLVVVSSQSTAIVEGPQSQTVFLDPSQNVAFSCKYTPSDFSRIEVITNGTVQHNIHQSLERDEKDSSLFVRSLSIARIQKYNVSMIQCRVENEIAKGLLLIQGPPEAVSHLTVETSGDDVVVTWQAPFTLDVTGVEYDLYYSLLISDVTNETQPVPVACDICHNLTETTFIFTPHNSPQRPSFMFTVTPYNGAGRGPPRTAALSGGGIYSSLVTLLTETITSVIKRLSPSASVPTEPDRKGNETSPGKIPGIVIGVIAALGIVAGLLMLFTCIKCKCIAKLRSQSRNTSLLIGESSSVSTVQSEDIIALQTLEPPFSSTTSTDKGDESQSCVRQRFSTSSN